MSERAPKPSVLYPGGFAVVPLALMKQAGKKAKHLAVFSARYSLAYQEGALLVARDARHRRLVGRHVRFRRADLERWIEERADGSAVGGRGSSRDR